MSPKPWSKACVCRRLRLTDTYVFLFFSSQSLFVLFFSGNPRKLFVIELVGKKMMYRWIVYAWKTVFGSPFFKFIFILFLFFHYCFGIIYIYIYVMNLRNSIYLNWDITLVTSNLIRLRCGRTLFYDYSKEILKVEMHINFNGTRFHGRWLLLDVDLWLKVGLLETICGHNTVIHFENFMIMPLSLYVPYPSPYREAGAKKIGDFSLEIPRRLSTRSIFKCILMQNETDNFFKIFPAISLKSPEYFLKRSFKFCVKKWTFQLFQNYILQRTILGFFPRSVCLQAYPSLFSWPWEWL